MTAYADFPLRPSGLQRSWIIGVHIAASVIILMLPVGAILKVFLCLSVVTLFGVDRWHRRNRRLWHFTYSNGRWYGRHHVTGGEWLEIRCRLDFISPWLLVLKVDGPTSQLARVAVFGDMLTDTGFRGLRRLLQVDNHVLAGEVDRNQYRVLGN